MNYVIIKKMDKTLKGNSHRSHAQSQGNPLDHVQDDEQRHALPFIPNALLLLHVLRFKN